MKIEKANIEKVSYVLNSYADIAIIKNLKKTSAIRNFDVNILYADELPRNTDLFSWDSTGPVFYRVFMDATAIIGENPFKYNRPPGEDAIVRSVMFKMQYFLYRIRKFMLEDGKSYNAKHYFIKRLPVAARTTLMLKGVWYSSEIDALKNFSMFFPTAFSHTEISTMLRSQRDPSAVDTRTLYSLYKRFYTLCKEYLDSKSETQMVNIWNISKTLKKN